MPTDISKGERTMLGCGALIYALFPVAIVVGVAVFWLIGQLPPWLMTTGFLSFIVFAGFSLPFHLVFAAVAAETLPEDQLSLWRPRFRQNPFAFFIFWRRYLR
jgi:hypothetical protein